MAVSEELTTKVVLSFASGPNGRDEFWIEVLTDPDAGTWEQPHPQTQHEMPELVAFHPPGITFPGNEVVFSPRGSLSISGQIVIATPVNGETSVFEGQLATGRFPVSGGNLR